MNTICKQLKLNAKCRPKTKDSPHSIAIADQYQNEMFPVVIGYQKLYQNEISAWHYHDLIMTKMASQITSLAVWNG